MCYSLYIHTNRINNKVYIGITSQQCERRWGKDGKGYKFQPKFYNAIQKYGWENFQHEVLYTNLKKDEALKIEAALIKKYNSTEEGYNVSPYGNVESKRIICLTTQEIFNSINEAAIYGKVDNSNLSHYLKGEWDTCGELNGVKLTWEYVDYPEENLQAQQRREQRKHYREAKFYTLEAQEIIDKYKHGATLRQLSKEYHKSRESIKTLLHFHNITIINSKEQRARRVCQLDNNRNIIATYNSLVEAATSIGISPSNTGRIKRACEEPWRKVKGYYWEWKE